MAAPGKVIPLLQIQSEQEQSLYEVQQKIYPRSVHGWFAGWRWALVWITQIIYYGTPWLTWNERQAVLFDLVARKFYIFGIVFWPQDFIYLTILLMIAAFSLFLFTAVAGRLWCGYACPQTVYTEIFLWIERVFEGDRLRRMKLDAGPLSPRKVAVKAGKHGTWILLSLWTGFTLVGYFTPVHELGSLVIGMRTGPWENFWILFYALATYGNAGWMREQVCKYMCPYARFQGAMFDRDTLVITYDVERGEPRGARSRKADYKADGLGDCVDCQICVQVCPTGIDIRNGQQYECIGCAACIDGCNQVMDKMNYPRGLIRYATENSLREHFAWRGMLERVFRPRVLIYATILCTIISATLVSLWMRVPLKVDVIRDRAVLAREVEGGQIENIYRLQVMNTEEVTRHFSIAVRGVDGIQLSGIVQPVTIGPAAAQWLTLRLRVDPAVVPRGTHRIHFDITASDAAGRPDPQSFTLHEKSVFYRP